MANFEQNTKLKLLPVSSYITLPETDPLILYSLPVFGKLYRKRVEMALNECLGGEKILEVGYGSGVTFPNLKKLYKEIHGIDLLADPQEVEQMWEKHGVQVNLRKGDLLELPYADNSFDTVLLISILEHLHPEDQLVAMKEIRRVIKPGGQMIYGVPVERALMVFLFRMLGYNIREHHYSTEKEVAAEARNQFEEIEILHLNTVFGKVYEVGHFIKPLK